MESISTLTLCGLLLMLLVMSAAFSGSETAMMALNRYRLRHLANEKHRGAMTAQRLLERPDRLIGLILLGNNLVNFSAPLVATVLLDRLFGLGEWASPIVLAVMFLIFAELMPKTLAAVHPESFGFPAARVLSLLMLVASPFVRGVNWVVNGMLQAFGIRPDDTGLTPLSREELRTVVKEAGSMIPLKHRQMLFGILDLEKASIEDIMVPRSEIQGIDLQDDFDEILDDLGNCRHTRLPVFDGNINDIVGILHARQALRMLQQDDLNIESLRDNLQDPYFIPAGTPLHIQLRNFQRQRRRLGLVVDEYGEIDGLVTLDDLLEEIVGEFTTDPDVFERDIHYEDDGSYLVDGAAMIRDLNRMAGWHLRQDGPKTINGLILEEMETIPESGTSLKIGDYAVEIVNASDQAVKVARFREMPATETTREPDRAGDAD